MSAELVEPPPAVKPCPRCENYDIPATDSICSECDEEIAEDLGPDGRWVNTPQGWDLRMITLFRQTEKFRVERYKQLRDQPGRPWKWVTVGYFTAPTMAEARAMARDAIADKLCILRAIREGEKR